MVDDSSSSNNNPSAENGSSSNGNSNASVVVDEEARLKDKLEGKKKEVELKKKILEKKERRNSETNDTSSSDKNNKKMDNGEGGSSSNKNNNNSGRDDNDDKNNRRSKSSSDNNNRYVVPQRRGENGNVGRGPPPHWGGGGRGPPGGHGGRYFDGPPGPYGRRGGDFRDDFGRGPHGGRYFDGPPGPYGRRGGDFRDDFGRGPPPRGGGGYGPGGGGFYEEDPFGRAPRRQLQPPPPRSRSRSRSYSSRSRSLSRSYSRDRSSPRSGGGGGGSPRLRSRSRSRDPSENGRGGGSPFGSGGSSKKRGRSPEGRRNKNNKHRRRSSDRRSGRDRRRSSRSRRDRSPSTSGSSISSSSSSSSSSSEESSNNNNNKDNKTSKMDAFTKDQRTVFVNQLIMRTTARDIKRYFRRKVQAKVADVTLLTDRRTGKHKGCAYVEMKTMEDVSKALQVSGQPPDFQRFPILIKPSEAEKNYIVPTSGSSATAAVAVAPNHHTTDIHMGKGTNDSSGSPVVVGGGNNTKTLGPMIGPNGQVVEAQKVYVGSLDPTITEDHLFKLFGQFGDLLKVQLQLDSSSGISRGFAFLSFRDPKEANLAIQTMSNQVLGGRPMKTGWATHSAGTAGVHIVTSDEFPVDASARAQKAHIALAQLAIGAASSIATPTSVGGVGVGGTTTALGVGGCSGTPGSVAEARQQLAAAAATNIVTTTMTTPVPPTPTDPKVVGRKENPSEHLLIANMFDKDEETDPGWDEDIKEEFQEECQKFGTIERVLVMSKDPGGKIYASFATIEAAQNCASSLAGRWFDKRQLRVEFVDGNAIPAHA